MEFKKRHKFAMHGKLTLTGHNKNCHCL